MTAESDREDIWELAKVFRKAVNRERYDGRAPNDSNALTEVWPTAAGAAFTFEMGGEILAVIIAPAADVTGGLARPDYSAWPA